MEGQKPSVGRIVHYKLTEEQAEAVNRRRVARPHDPEWPAGAQAHVGNSAHAGDVVPLIIARIWPDEYGPGFEGVNGQAFLDGNDQLWVTSVKQGTGPGEWSWPPRA
jgi:hypothetical protein